MHGSAGSRNSILVPRRSASCWATSADCRDDVAAVDGLGVERRRVRVVPADLQQVGEQRLEPLQLALQQLRRPGTGPARARSRAANSTSAAILIVVSGVRSSCETSETNCRCTWDRSSSCAHLVLQAGRHLVERRGQRGQLVLAADLHPLVEAARSASRWRAGAACRTGITTHRVTSQAIAASRNTSASPTSSSVRWTWARLLLLGQREEVVELVARVPNGGAPIGQARRRAGCRPVLMRASGRTRAACRRLRDAPADQAAGAAVHARREPVAGRAVDRVALLPSAAR